MNQRFKEFLINEGVTAREFCLIFDLPITSTYKFLRSPDKVMAYTWNNIEHAMDTWENMSTSARSTALYEKTRRGKRNAK